MPGGFLLLMGLFHLLNHLTQNDNLVQILEASVTERSVKYKGDYDE